MSGAPSVVIGVSINGKTVWKHADGYANVELNVPASPSTIMRIASISKPITATLLARLVSEGKLDLDAPISKYLSEDKWPSKYWQGKKVDITLRQLAAHLGGIRHYKKKNEDNSDVD